MNMDAKPQQEHDPIEDAGTLLKRLAHSARSMDTEQTVVLASAVLAVAVELRRIHNALVDIKEAA